MDTGKVEVREPLTIKVEDAEEGDLFGGVHKIIKVMVGHPLEELVTFCFEERDDIVFDRGYFINVTRIV